MTLAGDPVPRALIKHSSLFCEMLPVKKNLRGDGKLGASGLSTLIEGSVVRFARLLTVELSGSIRTFRRS